MPTRKAGGLKGIKGEIGQEYESVFSVSIIFIRYGNAGKGITNWKFTDFFSRLFHSVSNTDFVLCCKATFPGKYLISCPYFPART